MNITIPPEALEKGARKMAVQYYGNTETGHQFWEDFKEDARAAFNAMIEAWPGMMMADHPEWALPALILPLTQEKTDDR